MKGNSIEKNWEKPCFQASLCWLHHNWYVDNKLLNYLKKFTCDIYGYTQCCAVLMLYEQQWRRIWSAGHLKKLIYPNYNHAVTGINNVTSGHVLNMIWLHFTYVSSYKCSNLTNWNPCMPKPGVRHTKRLYMLTGSTVMRLYRKMSKFGGHFGFWWIPHA